MSGLSSRAYPGVPQLLTTGEVQHNVYDDLKKANLLSDTFINQNTSLAQDAFPIGPTPVSATFEFKELSAPDVERVDGRCQIKLPLVATKYRAEF